MCNKKNYIVLGMNKAQLILGEVLKYHNIKIHIF